MNENLQQKLDNRYRTALITVGAVFVLTLVFLFATFFFGGAFYREGFENYTKYFWAVILILGLAAFIWRRTRFSRQNLRDILTLRGADGAVSYLQSTSILLALLGALIVIAGFILTVLSGDFMDAVRVAIVAFIVLFISFPRKSDWQKVAGTVNKNG